MAVLAQFISVNLAQRLTDSAKKGQVFLKRLFFCLFVLFSTIALMRPMFGERSEMVERRGVDVMIALDVSKSMLAHDHTPNRLERAKHEISKFVGLLRGDRVGLIIFAGESFVQCPLTLDYSALLSFLRPITTDWINVQGTAIAETIHQAINTLDSQSRKHKVLVIVSDGEDHEGNIEEAAREAAQKGLIIHTVGIGSEKGVPIPIRGTGANIRYKTDQSGNVVLTRLNPATLEKIALQTNGRYFHAGPNFDFSLVYEEIETMEKKDFAMTQTSSLEERYQIFMVIALLFLFIQFFISERTKRDSVWKGRFEG